MTALDRFHALVGLGTPHLPDDNDPEDVVNVTPEDVNAHIRTIMSSEDMRGALLDLIDAMAAESNALMSAGRRDHTDMLFHHGAYARLTELKMELSRLAGLTQP